MEKPKVLIVDDEPAIHKTFQKALKNAGYELLFAKNGEEGLEKLRQTTPVLIFLDLKMPVMDGFEFLDRIRIKPADPYLVVVITGHGYDEEVQKSYELGVNFFLRKPLSMTEICGLAKRCIGLKQIEHELREHRDHLEQLVEERTQTIQEQLLFQQNLIDSIPTPIFFKNKELEYLGCNSSFEKYMRIKRDKIIGKTVYDIVEPEMADLHHQKDLLVLKRKAQTYESSLVVGKGKNREVIFCKAAFKDSNRKVAGLIGAMFDITERKAAEQALTARSAQLEEANTALRVILDQIGNTKMEVEKRVYRNVKELVLPNLERLKARTTSIANRDEIEIIRSNLTKLTNAPTHRLNSTYLTLSPREIQIADLIRLGKSNKSIGLLLNISKSAVEFHRNNLREKLGLKHKHLNLRTYLMTME